MNRRTFAASLLGLVLSLVTGSSWAQQATRQLPTRAAPPLNAQQIVDNVEGFYKQIKTFRASFKQRYFVAAYGTSKDSAGSVIFEKPGKMSWDYTSNGNHIVSNGQTLKFYDRGNRQMYVQPVSTTQYPALAFLTGQGSLTQSFTFTQLNAAQMKFPTGYVLLGLPAQPSAVYSRVYFYVDARTFQVRRVLIEDVQGNRNRLDFDSPSVNAKAPPNAFVFAPPPGTQIIQPSGAQGLPSVVPRPAQP